MKSPSISLTSLVACYCRKGTPHRRPVACVILALMAASLAGCSQNHAQTNDESGLSTTPPGTEKMGEILPGIHARLRQTDDYIVPLTAVEKKILAMSIKQFKGTQDYFASDMSPLVEAAWYPHARTRFPHDDHDDKCVIFVRHSQDKQRCAYAAYSSDGMMRMCGGGKADPDYATKGWTPW